MLLRPSAVLSPAVLSLPPFHDSDLLLRQLIQLIYQRVDLLVAGPDLPLVEVLIGGDDLWISLASLLERDLCLELVLG